MWGRAGGAAPQVLLLLLLLPGSLGLRCFRCGAEGEGPCPRDPAATNVTSCPPGSDVCTEAWTGLTWSHGTLALGGRGCGRGLPGALSRGLDVSGLVAFGRRRQCRGGGEGREEPCNGEIPMGGTGSPPAGPAPPEPPNGLRCYGCHDDGPCPPLRIVQCYGNQSGCFHGNLSLSLGGLSLWREIRGCSREASCRWAAPPDDVIGLRGSCCAGDLCNAGPAPFFAPDWPRLQLLPHGHAPSAPPKMAAEPLPANGSRAGGEATPKMAATTSNMAATTSNMAATTSNMAATTSKMAAPTPKMAAGGGDKMAAPTPPKMAAGVTWAEVDRGTSKMAAGSGMETGNGMGTGNKMAAGRAGGGGGGGVKGPVGRGQRGAGPDWLLPFLLLPLLC